MAAAANGVDIAFISSFGTRNRDRTINAGDIYAITTLEPRVTMPMHCGGCEDRYAAFASEVLLALGRHSARRPARWGADVYLFGNGVAARGVAHHECHGLAS